MFDNEFTPQPQQNSEPSSELEEKVLKGRESVSPEAALSAQKKLVVRIAPQEILKEISNLDFDDPEYEDGHPIFDALFMRYMDMYVTEESGRNSFEDFCNVNEDNIDLMDRIREKKTTDEDLDMMYKFMVNNYVVDGLKIERPFFKDKRAVEKFLDEILETT